MLIEGACTASQLSCVIAHLFADLEPPCGRCRENALVVQGITVSGQRAYMVIGQGGYELTGSPEDCRLAERLIREQCANAGQ